MYTEGQPLRGGLQPYCFEPEAEDAEGEADHARADAHGRAAADHKDEDPDRGMAPQQ